jgi:uncharacterized small protein (DUF1192 family)
LGCGLGFKRKGNTDQQKDKPTGQQPKGKGKGPIGAPPEKPCPSQEEAGGEEPKAAAKVSDVLSQLKSLLPPGVGSAQVEALEAEWQKAQEQANQSPGNTGPSKNKKAGPEPPTLDELRKLHQKFERHEEQVERAQQKVDKCEAQIAKLQKELAECKAHLDQRVETRDAAKKAFDEADLRHRVARPLETEDSEVYELSQVVAATAWVAAKAKTAGQEKPPREIRRTYRSLLQVWNSFEHLDFESSSDEEDEQDDKDLAESVHDESMENKSDKSGGGHSTPKGGTSAPASPLPEPDSVSGGQPREDETGERRAKAAKTSGTDEVGPLATSFHQRYPAPPLPALVLPKVTSRRGGSKARKEGREGSSTRSRSPVPSYKSPAEDSEAERAAESK